MTPAEATEICRGMFPELIGIEFLELEHGRVDLRMEVHTGLLAPNGYLHGGAVTALADTACGYGAVTTIGDDTVGFATMNLQCNFIGTALSGFVHCEARLAHGGRTTQVWDATVRRDDGREIALFRCTQLLLQSTAS